MPQLLIALLILALAWYGLKLFARTPPAFIARVTRVFGGGLATVTGLFLLLRGRPDLGIIGIGAGLWLFGFFKLTGRAKVGNWGRRAAGVSRVRSAMIEMELDHNTGVMSGFVLAGPDEGQTLDSFPRPGCEALYRLCKRDDPEGARLLETYMDRRFPGWRQTGQAEADAGRGDVGTGRAGALTEDEAYEILGLWKGAPRDEIVRAHRALMKKLHPDHGGTTDLAARVNEAKDVLMRRHR